MGYIWECGYSKFIQFVDILNRTKVEILIILDICVTLYVKLFLFLFR